MEKSNESRERSQRSIERSLGSRERSQRSLEKSLRSRERSIGSRERSQGSKGSKERSNEGSNSDITSPAIHFNRHRERSDKLDEFLDIKIDEQPVGETICRSSTSTSKGRHQNINRYAY
jgi:hypothetical protein